MNKRFLEQCEQEALQFSGAIQGHGSLLLADADGRVCHVAANIAEFLGDGPAAWLGRPLPAGLATLAARLDSVPGSRKVYAAALEVEGGALDVVVIRGAQGSVLLELNRSAYGREIPPRPSSIPPAPPIADAEGVDRARREITAALAGLSGFQRTLYYCFREDGDGEVVAETRQGDAYGSYAGLRFPASDIPRIARALYLLNPWRMIPDAAAPPVPVMGCADSPPDLTWSDLRSVSPVHALYLANMGVRASLSFPIVIGGTLSALIAAHHGEVRCLPVDQLEYMASLVRAHAFAVAAWQSMRRMRLVDSLSRRFGKVRDLLCRHGDLASAWPEMAAWLMSEFAADGAILLVADETPLRAGIAFEPAALDAFDAWFMASGNDFVWSGDSLSRQLPAFPLSEVAGALALRIATPAPGCRICLYLTRIEHVHEVAWGGNPEKPLEHHDGVLGLAPRRSFEKWVEKRLGYSRSWNNESRLLALNLRQLLQQEIRIREKP